MPWPLKQAWRSRPLGASPSALQQSDRSSAETLGTKPCSAEISSAAAAGSWSCLWPGASRLPVHMYVYMYVYFHFLCIYMCICNSMYVYVCVNIHIDLDIYVHIYIYICMLYLYML